MLSGCATSHPTSASKPHRQLPPAPAFVQRVTVKAPKAGDDLELVAARERAGRAKANDINACFLQWYGVIVQTYGSEAGDEDAGAIRAECEKRVAK